MSAYSNLAGMFGSQNGLMQPNISQWPYPWQPIPVHTIPSAQDHVSDHTWPLAQGNVREDCTNFLPGERTI